MAFDTSVLMTIPPFSLPVGREGCRDEARVRQAARPLHRALQDAHRLHGEDQVGARPGEVGWKGLRGCVFLMFRQHFGHAVGATLEKYQIPSPAVTFHTIMMNYILIVYILVHYSSQIRAASGHGHCQEPDTELAGGEQQVSVLSVY